jgi:carboxymethylenebutenolidase
MQIGGTRPLVNQAHFFLERAMKIQDPHIDSLLPPLSVNRRGFIAGALAVGFSAAAGPAVAQTAIKTSDEGLTAGTVMIPTADGLQIPAYRAMPAGKKHLPTILVVEEIFGVHEYIQDVCRRLAHLGYLAIAPELFAREGDPAKYTEMVKLRSEVVDKVPDAQAMSDLDAAASYATHNGGDSAKVGIMGFCWGGRYVWLYAAHSTRLKAAAVFYGPLRGKKDALRPSYPIDVTGKLHAPVIAAYGGKDAGISHDDIEAMREALPKGDKSAKASHIDVYPDAQHGFHADYRPSYNKPDAELAWKRMQEWFNHHGLKGAK